MAIPANIQKARKDILKTLSDSGAVDAAVGTADLAVKTLRKAGADVSNRVASFDAKALRDQAQATVASAPEQVKTFPTKAQAVVGGAVSTARTTYDDLAVRGKDLVTRVRGQQATQDVKKQAASTTAHAKATATTAKKAAADTATAASTGASTTSATAKKAASRTKTSAKSTTTSAKKTATAAKKAADSAADKVGD